MKRITCLITLTMLLFVVGSINAEEIHEIALGDIEGAVTVDGKDCLVAGQEIVIPIIIKSSGLPECKFAPAMTFVIESTDGAKWENAVLEYYTELRPHPQTKTEVPWTCATQFSQAFFEGFSVDGSGGDTLGFAGIVFGGDQGIYDGMDEKCFLLKFKPTAKSIGKTICINTGGERRDGFNMGWVAIGKECKPANEVLMPAWGGPFCFKIVAKK